MKIALTGYSGLMGSKLANLCSELGWEWIPLERKLLLSDTDILAKRLEGCTVVVNLAGAPIVKRWTSAYQKQIIDSRINTTKNLVSALHQLDEPVKLFISASASGIYENGGPYTESNALLSDNFLGRLCQAWEKEAFRAEDVCRVVIFRFGVVLDAKRGALPKLLPSFKWGLGARIGRGDQYFPWIHVTDVIRAFRFAMENPQVTGVVNLVAPQVINNIQFTKALSGILNRPAWFSIPLWMLKLVFGKGSITLSEGAAILPQKLTSLGFSFHFPQIKEALKNIVKPE